MRRQTGGGPPPPPLSATSEWVSGILKESVSGIESQYDGDVCSGIVVEPPPTSVYAEINVMDISQDAVEVQDVVKENIKQQSSPVMSATFKRHAARKTLNATPHQTRQSFLELAKMKKELVQLKTKNIERQDESSLVHLREEKCRLEMDLLKKEEQRKQELHELQVLKMKLEIDILRKKTE
ncbi:uncharacterized protein LOC123878680 [Maniola jurtina]|uniref:uncharacterized protein LOC123878680 n=1 Tax=Maniola jurtina TaxID=191418 RepID=UPI001E68C288|nr:uncharacterized protein LOC123878680 [Maniola jurtina]